LYGEVVLLITGSARRSSIEISNDAYKSSMATIRRVFVGSRAELEAMNRAVAARRLRPVVDRVFGFDEVGAAFDHLISGRAFGKVVIAVG
jgi:NADPH:quinone reductase-like Zn-dependent oxidoreductase